MELIRNLRQDKFSVREIQEQDCNTVYFEIKQKATSALELSDIVSRFADDNFFDKLDTNLILLVIDEFLVSVLLPNMEAGFAMQFYLTYNRSTNTTIIGIGYPGETYDPFKDDDVSFMLNVFRKSLSDIKFSNTSNSFNEWFLKIDMRDIVPVPKNLNNEQKDPPPPPCKPEPIWSVNASRQKYSRYSSNIEPNNFPISRKRMF